MWSSGIATGFGKRFLECPRGSGVARAARDFGP